MRRVLVFFAAAVVLVAGSHLRAQAITETCPAAITIAAVGPSDAHHAQGNTFAFAMHAPSPRSLQGRLVLYTDKGWFATAIPKVALRIKVPLQQSATGELWRSSALSVTLPQRVTVRRAFLADAVTDAQTWSPPAPITCLQGAGPGYADAKPGAKPYIDVAGWFKDVPITGSVALRAATAEPLGSTACAEPFKDAVATYAMTPQRPEFAPQQSTPAVVDVGIILRSDGTVQEAWPVRSSGIRAFDDAAVKAAEDSIYEPAVSLCQGVPSEYIFAVTFSK